MRSESHCRFPAGDNHGCPPPLSGVGEIGVGQDKPRTARRGASSLCLFFECQRGCLFPKEYEKLASSLIRTIAELDGETKLARIFEHMKEAAVSRYSPRMAGKSLRRRVAEMAKIMTQTGYMTGWKQLDHRTFQIVEHNCAVACVAQQCQHACMCELSMFRELLQATVSRQEHIVAGDHCCRYIVQSQQARKPSQRNCQAPPICEPLNQDLYSETVKECNVS